MQVKCGRKMYELTAEDEIWRYKVNGCFEVVSRRYGSRIRGYVTPKLAKPKAHELIKSGQLIWKEDTRYVSKYKIGEK